jgi:hypothetical protein
LIGGEDSRRFTIGEKHLLSSENRVPGPGTYNPLDHLIRENSPAQSISPSRRDREISDALRNQPGPGHYDPATSLKEPRSPLAKINPVPSYEGGGIKDTPGPGTYDPELSAVKERAPAAKMAKSKRDFLTLSTGDLAQPAPGQYNPHLPGNS